MNEILGTYLKQVARLFKDDNHSEQSYRPALKALLEAIETNVEAINEPSGLGGGNRPDLMVKRRSNEVLVGHIETKPVQTKSNGLDAEEFREQFDRYRKNFENLLFTDYLEFQFYVQGVLEGSVRIAEVKGDSIRARQENYEEFIERMEEFLSHKEPITEPERLAQSMARKAKKLQNKLETILLQDGETKDNTGLVGQWRTFGNMLIHEISEKKFATMYAETLTYGLLAARVWVEDGSRFNLKQAADNLPKSNPFLRKLFQSIAGFDLDPGLKKPLEDLAQVLEGTNLSEVLEGFSGAEKQDPIIHFYETFLDHYDPERRKETGSYYTPDAVVDFLVRSVDGLLKEEFDLNNGLARRQDQPRRQGI